MLFGEVDERDRFHGCERDFLMGLVIRSGPKKAYMQTGVTRAATDIEIGREKGRLAVQDGSSSPRAIARRFPEIETCWCSLAARVREGNFTLERRK